MTDEIDEMEPIPEPKARTSCDNPTPDYDVIWLQPLCFGEGRCWCEEPQDVCEHCGREWIKYVRYEEPWT